MLLEKIFLDTAALKCLSNNENSQEEKLELGGWEARAGSGNKGTEVWSKEDWFSGQFREEKLDLNLGAFVRAEKGRAFPLVLIWDFAPMVAAKGQDCKTGNETEPGRPMFYTRGWQFFFCKEMDSKYCRLCTVAVFVAITQLGKLSHQRVALLSLQK